jgi:hypothetical protein
MCLVSAKSVCGWVRVAFDEDDLARAVCEAGCLACGD